MKTYHLDEWHRLLIIAIAPILIMIFLLAIGWTIGAIQYAPSLFTEDYVQRYRTPSSVLEEVEQVIQQGNLQRAKELQGVRWSPRYIKPIPKFHFSTFWNKDEKYQDYLYFDSSNYHRYVIHIKIVNGRYVWVPESLTYYVDSGRWVRTFFPVLTIWWLVVFLYIVTRRAYLFLSGFKPEEVSHPSIKK
jgi:hypothetical protein